MVDQAESSIQRAATKVLLYQSDVRRVIFIDMGNSYTVIRADEKINGKTIGVEGTGRDNDILGADQLFGKDGARAMAATLEKRPKTDPQLLLFPEMEQAQPPKIRGRGRKPRLSLDSDSAQFQEATTLDRVHAAMLLQAGGQPNALRALIKTEQDRGPEFLRLANALSALYPKGSEEKRLLDAMLLAVPR